jgi:hypothetical protein
VRLAPEALGPEMRAAVAERLSLWFPRRKEDQLDAQGEGHPPEPPAAPRGLAQAGEGCVVVELQEVGHSHPGAGLPPMGAHRGGGLVAAAGLRQRVRVRVPGVKDDDRLPAFAVARRPVTMNEKKRVFTRSGAN